MNLKPKVYYFLKFPPLALRFLSDLFQPSEKQLIKTEQDSKARYDLYTDREQKAWETASTTCLWYDKITSKSLKELREEYLKPIYQIIESIKTESPISPIRILEIGCGNCINLAQIKQKYPEIKLYGIDISQSRIDVAKQYFGPALDGITLSQQSVTEKTNFEDGHFDLVFSMHCLEQISYHTQAALKEISRLTNKKIVMIEPVFENGNPAQKLYLYRNDHNRILLKEIRDLHLNIKIMTSLPVQSNPLNQSTVIEIEK